MKRNGLLVALLALVTLTVGCAGTGPVYVDPRFTAEERLEIQKAADMWTAAGAVVDLVWNVPLALGEPGRHTLVRADHRQALALDGTFANPDQTGRYNGTLLITDMDTIRENRDVLSVVVAHEMGHMLGLRHVGSGDALMSEKRNDDSPVVLSAVDIAECRRVGSCAAVGASQ